MAKLSPSWDMGIWNSELPGPSSRASFHGTKAL